jgi:hypothetical protein
MLLRSPFARSCATLCLFAAVLVFVSGCAFMSDEDRDFYGKGWINPKELDQQPMHHAIPNPEAPDDSAAPAATAGTHSNSDSDEWTAPPLQ